MFHGFSCTSKSSATTSSIYIIPPEEVRALALLHLPYTADTLLRPRLGDWRARCVRIQRPITHRAAPTHFAVQDDAAGHDSADSRKGRSAFAGRSAQSRRCPDICRRRLSGLESVVKLRLGEEHAGELEYLVGTVQLSWISRSSSLTHFWSAAANVGVVSSDIPTRLKVPN